MRKSAILLSATMVCLLFAFTWPGQEQPKKKDDEIVNQQPSVSPVSAEQILGLEDKPKNAADFVGLSHVTSAKDRGANAVKTLNRIAEANPSLSAKTGTAQAPGGAPSASPGDIALKLNKLQKIQGLSKAVNASNNVTAEIESLRISSNKSIADLPRLQAQINEMIDLQEKLGTRNQNNITNFHQAIELTRAHERVLEELEKADPDESEVTVVSEEEILRQEMIRLKQETAAPESQG